MTKLYVDARGRHFAIEDGRHRPATATERAEALSASARTVAAWQEGAGGEILPPASGDDLVAQLRREIADVRGRANSEFVRGVEGKAEQLVDLGNRLSDALAAVEAAAKFTKQNTKLEYYRVRFGSPFAVLVRSDGSPLFASGFAMADAACVAQTPNAYDDGLSVMSVSDSVWSSADKVKSIVGADHGAMVDFANRLAAVETSAK